MRALVVGSTGHLGREVARQLATAGHDVRALVRESSDPRTVEMLRSAGVTTFVGDLRDAASLAAACENVDVVISTATALASEDPENDLEVVDRSGQGALVDAAEAAGVSRFVFVSVLGIEPDSPFTDAKLATEARLHASSMSHTILQPSIFMETWFSEHVGFDWKGGAVAIFGDGQTPMNWVSSDDVATVVAAVVDDPEAADSTIPVLGPESLSPAAVVAIWETVIGSSISRNEVPVEALRDQLAAAGHPTEKSFASLMLRYAAGDPPASMPPNIPAPTTTVEDFARRAATGS